MKAFKAMVIAGVAVLVVSSALGQTPANQPEPQPDVDRRYIEPNAWPPSPGDRYYEAWRQGQAQLDQPAEPAQQAQQTPDLRHDRYTALQPQRMGRCLQVSELIKADARGRSGEDLGHIEDVTLDMDRMQVLYLVLAHGGVLGLGTEYFAIPCNELDQLTTRRIDLSLSKAELDDRDAFTGAESDWPRRADAAWLASPRGTSAPRSATVENWHKASKLLGVDVENRQGQTLGEIEDIVIDAERDRVAYIVISREDDENRLLAIPASAMTIEPDNEAILDMSSGELDRFQTFAEGNAPDFDDVSWGRQVHRDFNVPVYWEEPAGQFEIDR